MEPGGLSKRNTEPSLLLKATKGTLTANATLHTPYTDPRANNIQMDEDERRIQMTIQ